jgi:phospholipase/lecithinase/hemolysin
MLIPGYIFADARSEIILENNCNEPVTFTIDGDNAGSNTSKYILPGAYFNAGRYINSNTFTHTTSNIKISFFSQNYQGSLNFLLHNGWTSNKAEFKNYRGTLEVGHDSYNKIHKKKWHSYTLSAKKSIPSFTISACAQSLNIQDSFLDGVKRILIFGDSLSDQGNLYHYTKGLIPKSLPYYNGMFSNGASWATQLSNRLKLNHVPVSNYAVGGATTIFEPEWASIGLPYSLSSELIMYNIDTDASSTHNKLAIFFIGANDYLTASSNMSIEQIIYAVNKVTNKIKSGVEFVNASKTILIGLPNLGLTPQSKDLKNQNILKELSSKHNQILKQYAETHSERVMFIDTNKIFNMLLNNTTTFNKKYHTFMDPRIISNSCWMGGYFLKAGENQKLFYKLLLTRNETNENIPVDINSIPLVPDIISSILAGESGQMCNEPSRVAFWDQIHPTYQAHKALYQYLLESLKITINVLPSLTDT